MYDARNPDAPARVHDASLVTAKLVPTRISPTVLAKVGETFAAALSALQRSLGELIPMEPAAQTLVDAALGEIARLEHLGVQLQELARVMIGDSPQAPERVDLARAARVAAAEWTRTAQLLGASLSGPHEPYELEVNAAALAQLLDFGIECALHIGSGIEIDAGLQGLPPRPMLTIRVERSIPRDDDRDPLDDLHWLLFVQLARAVGLVPQRLEVGRSVTLMLGFPAAEQAVRGDAAPNPVRLMRTAPATGRRVLLIEPQDLARMHAHRLMNEVGMRVDAAASLEQARAALGRELPDAVVTGIPLSDERCATLVEELRSGQPRLRVLELVDDDNAFSFSVPGSDHAGRVSRADMGRTLVSALTQELDAA